MVGIHATGGEFPISLWMRRVTSIVPGEVRYVVVVEPVIRVELQVALDEGGKMMWGDNAFLQRFGFDLSAVLDRSLAELIPGVKLERSGNEALVQHVTCHGNEQHPTPCTLTLSAASVAFAEEIAMVPDLVERAGNVETLGVMHVYTTLSGLISVNNDGTVYGCNENFVLLLLGYNEKQVCGEDVTKILPDIFDEMMSFPPQIDFGDTPVNESSMSNASGGGGGGGGVESMGGGTPSASTATAAPRYFFEGVYSGKAIHADGSDIRVWYQVRTVLREEGQAMHCIWLSGDNQPSDQLDRSFDGLKSTSSTASCTGASPLSTSTSAAAAVDLDASFGSDRGGDSLSRLDEEGANSGAAAGYGSSRRAANDEDVSLVGEHNISVFSTVSGGNGSGLNARAASVSPASSDLSGGGGDDNASIRPEEGFEHAYFTQDELGRGSFGFVKKCTHIESGDG